MQYLFQVSAFWWLQRQLVVFKCNFDCARTDAVGLEGDPSSRQDEWLPGSAERLGTYHTPINAAVHHDFYKIVLAVEGCIFTCLNVPTCNPPLGKKKTHKLKLNFGLDELPALMYKAVKYSKMWNHYKQDAERYIFRNHAPEQVQSMLEELIKKHCSKLRQHIVKNEAVRTPLVFAFAIQL
jgi:hypothetical protein